MKRKSNPIGKRTINRYYIIHFFEYSLSADMIYIMYHINLDFKKIRCILVVAGTDMNNPTTSKMRNNGEHLYIERTKCIIIHLYSASIQKPAGLN